MSFKDASRGLKSEIISSRERGKKRKAHRNIKINLRLKKSFPNPESLPE